MGLFFSDSHKSGEGRIRHQDLDKHLKSLGIEREHRETVINQFKDHTNGRDHITGEDIDKVMKRMKGNSDDGIDRRHVDRIHEHLSGLVHPVEHEREHRVIEKPSPREELKPDKGIEHLDIDVKK